MSDEKVYFDLSTNKAWRDDYSQVINDNAPQVAYGTIFELEVQLLNAKIGNSFTNVYTGFASKTITGSAAVDFSYYKRVAAQLNTALSNGVPVSEIIIDNAGDNFNATRPKGKVQLSATEYAYYNAISESDGVYTLTTCNSSFVTADFTPSADYAENLSIYMILVPMITDSAVDVTDKDTGLLSLSLDADDLNYKAELNDNSEKYNTYVQFSITESGDKIMSKRIPIRCLGAIDGVVINNAPAPA